MGTDVPNNEKPRFVIRIRMKSASTEYFVSSLPAGYVSVRFQPYVKSV